MILIYWELLWVLLTRSRLWNVLLVSNRGSQRLERIDWSHFLTGRYSSWFNWKVMRVVLVELCVALSWLVDCRIRLPPDVITLSQGNTVRAWHLPDGALLWETRVQAFQGFTMGLVKLPVRTLHLFVVPLKVWIDMSYVCTRTILESSPNYTTCFGFTLFIAISSHGFWGRPWGWYC